MTPLVLNLTTVPFETFHCRSAVSVAVQVTVTLPPDLAGFGSCVIFTAIILIDSVVIILKIVLPLS